MNKQEAATFLGVSMRTLERLTQQGRISARYERGRTRPVPMYDREELERAKPEIESKMYPHRPTARNVANSGEIGASGETSASAASNDTALARMAEMPAVLDRLRSVMKVLRESEPAAVPIADKPLLKLAEVATLTGLSRNHLRAAIEEGKLKARIIGRGFRVKRSDLDAYVRKL
jgi:excisionase family DNA binding protein